MQVYQFISLKTGRPVNNHNVIQEPERTTLTSYGTKVACAELDENEQTRLVLAPYALEYSRTTSKYILEFAHAFFPDLRQRWRVPADLRKAVNAGEVMVADII